ncbi:MAG: hypothetical protein CMI53_00130 [Parcubacteria group bacterium]|jgi:hypothetical protein|nr:hypothetical protein [Parcubacteria group bacterium]
MASKNKISIVIVSWKVKDLLNKCLTSIFTYQQNLDLEVIVIDNNSNDGTVDMVKNNFPKVLLIKNKKNIGFAKANNLGIAKANGNYILVLNPDTEILKNTIQEMVSFMDKNPQAGIVGPKHLNPDKTIQPSVRRFPSLLAVFLILIKLPKVLNLKSVNKFLATDVDYNNTQPVDQVAGSFMFIRQEVLAKIGNFDEKFFIWFEDVDLCKRAKSADWQIWYNNKSQIIHYGGQSFKQRLTVKKQLLFFKSAWYYFKKHGFIYKN